MLEYKFQRSKVIIFISPMRTSRVADDASDAANSKTSNIHRFTVEVVHLRMASQTGFLCNSKEIMIAGNTCNPGEAVAESPPHAGDISGPASSIKCRDRVKITGQKDSNLA